MHIFLYGSRAKYPTNQANLLLLHLFFLNVHIRFRSQCELTNIWLNFFCKFKRPKIWAKFFMMIFLKIPTWFVIYYYSLVERLLELKTCLKENEEWVESINFLGIQSRKINQCPNLMNLSRVSNPPKTGFNWAPA